MSIERRDINPVTTKAIEGIKNQIIFLEHLFLQGLVNINKWNHYLLKVMIYL